MKQKIVLATGNQGKVREMADVLADFGFEVIAQTDLGIDSPEETGLTFVENAILKARYAAEKSGLPAIADDSGLVVDALNGAPGVLSARYAGANPKSDAANNKRLSDDLADKTDKSCYYVCVLVLVRHENDPQPIIAEGIWSGQWQAEAAGTNGFGYDPHFYLPEHNCTAAELDPEIKNAESHRGQALRELLRKIEAL